jgi:MFS family permease
MFVGSLLVSLWAGVLIDWFDRKKILILADLARALFVAFIPSLMKVDIRLVYVDLALISIATAFFRPAMFAVLPTIVNRRDLLPANSLFVTMSTGAEIVGPTVAGIIAFVYGYPPLLYLDAATYAFSALCLLVTRIQSTLEIVSRRVQWGSVTASVSEGLRYIRQDSLQWGLFVLIFPAYLVGSGLNALRTPLAKGIIGITDAQFGTFSSIWGVGFVTASLVLGWFGVRLRRSHLILGGFFLGFVSTAAMGLSNSFDSLLAAAFVVGFANTLNYVGLMTVLMEHTPQGIIGRVISTRQVALGSTRVLSPVVFGAIGDAWGVRQAIFSMALAGCVGTAAVAILMPVLRRFDASTRQSKNGIRRVLDYMIGKTNPEYDHAQQVTLNLITILIVVAAWGGVAYRVPIYGSAGLIFTFGLAVLGRLAKRRL